jgi:hypothetical protein
MIPVVEISQFLYAKLQVKTAKTAEGSGERKREQERRRKG